MKKSIINASPFLMLLIPVFLCIALLLVNGPQEVTPEKSAASAAFQVPSLKTMVKALF